MKVALSAISSAARLSAATQASGRGRVTSPMPSFMMSASGFAAENAAVRRATSAKR